MAHIIWCGNKKRNEVFNGDQPWDKEISEKDIPEKAVFLDRPADIVRASVPYMILPCIICFVAVLIKKELSDVFIFNLWFMPLSFLIGFIVAMPLHELFHAICYPKSESVYIGVSIKQLRAFACSAAALSRERYILMSLAPSALGVIPLVIFLACPITMKWLITICVAPMVMGLISPAPDYMDVILLLKKVPKGAIIQPVENGLVWYE
ncbi:MAG: DUF3267 domain-containing protein [Lachnospiraceae bacterium]|nr:DUF3267 domain-containing protein [Lachnospiraceae bacterium]